MLKPGKNIKMKQETLMPVYGKVTAKLRQLKINLMKIIDTSFLIYTSFYKNHILK